MKKILITNDDGIFGAGIEPLVKEVSKIANVIVVAPEKEKSAVSHSLTLHEAIRSRKIGHNSYIINGTPADCVRFGFIALCKYKLDLVISGINQGPNLGNDVIYSGTVGGAREGALLDVPSLAVSLVIKTGKYFKTAASFASRLSDILLNTEKGSEIRMRMVGSKEKLERIFLNVNIPDAPENKIAGVEITTLGKRIYDEVVHRRKDPYGMPYYWLKGRLLSGKNIPGTDINAVNHSRVSITPLSVNNTDKETLDFLRKFLKNEF
ncbi:MAG: 5'/3'-nucleotidase SurE [Elusimicrobiota bacterium]